jgi:hypothetical protein
MMGAISESLVKTVLLAMQWAFANILEIAMLLSGLMGPFAIAGAIAFDGKSLWAWLTGFLPWHGTDFLQHHRWLGSSCRCECDVTDTLGFLVIIACPCSCPRSRSCRRRRNGRLSCG